MPQQILDQTTDLNGQEQFRLCQLYEAPDFVKQASVEQLCGMETTPPHLFADQLHRRYPMGTKAATWLSSVFFVEKRAELAPREAAMIDARLMEAADYWGLANQFAALKEKAAEMAQDDLSRLPNEDFAWVAGTERQLPLRNALEVKAAAEYLHKWRDEFAFPDRQKMARAILQKAARYGAGLSDHDEFLERVAGFGGCSATEAAQLVYDRAKLARAKDQEVATELEKMAQMILANPVKSRSPHRLAKVAETIDQLDRFLHLRDYSEAIPRAEDVLFRITKKTASAFAEQHLATQSGSVYDRDDLARLRTKDVRRFLGDELADATTGDGIHVDGTKLAEIVPTLPLGDARIFDQLCSDVGVRRFAKEAAARQGLTRQDLLGMAAAHRPK
jgi:hypothetical protein